MNYIRIFGVFLMVIGAIGFVGATAWWYLFFEGLLGESVKQASACFYNTSLSCEVGNLAGTFGDVPTYDPAVMWVSVGLLAVGGLIYGLITTN